MARKKNAAQLAREAVDRLRKQAQGFAPRRTIRPVPGNRFTDSLNDNKGVVRFNPQTKRHRITFGRDTNRAIRAGGEAFLKSTSFIPTREVLQISTSKDPLLSKSNIKPFKSAALKTAKLAAVQGLAPAAAPALSKVPLAGKGLAVAARNPIGLGARNLLNPQIIGFSGALGFGLSKLTGQDSKLATAEAIGRAPGLAFGLGITSPILQSFGTTLNALKDPTVRQVVGRAVSGGANVVEGLALDKLTGLTTTPESIAIDFGVGALMPGQVGLKSNKQLIRDQMMDVAQRHARNIQRHLGVNTEASIFKIKDITPSKFDLDNTLKRQVASAKKNIKVGIFQPMVVDVNGNLLDGHHRYLAAQDLKIKDFPVVIQGGKPRFKTPLQLQRTPKEGKVGELKNILKSQKGELTIEGKLESKTGFKPGEKQEFDTALLFKDKNKLKKLVKTAPPEYQTRFSKEIDSILKSKSKGQVGKNAAGLLFGFEFEQDENGNWQYKGFNEGKALLGLAAAVGVQKGVSRLQAETPDLGLRLKESVGFIPTKTVIDDSSAKQILKGMGESSDVQAYKKAFNRGDVKALDGILAKHAGQADESMFALHTRVKSMIPKVGLKPKVAQADVSFMSKFDSLADMTQKLAKENPTRLKTLTVNARKQGFDSLAQYWDKSTRFRRAGTKVGLGIEDVSKKKTRGFVESVQEAEKVSKQVKTQTEGEFKPKVNKKLMGEAQALLQKNASIKVKNVKNIDKKVAATIQEALNLDRAGKHQAAASLYNNLAKQGTELGRGVQAFSLLNKMSPESVSISAASRIRQYNAKLEPGAKKIPDLTGAQQKAIADQVKVIDGLSGRAKNIAINDLKIMMDNFIPSTFVDKAITVWKAGLLTSFRTHERNLLGNTIQGGAEIGKDIPASVVDKLLSVRTGRRTLTLTTRGLGEGAQKGVRSAKDIVLKGFDPEDSIGKYDVKRITWGNNKVEKFLKAYTESVFRTLGAADKPFWNAAYGRSLYDQAGAQAINAGRQGNEKFIQALVKNPTEEMLLQATKDANVSTFRDKNVLSEVASGLKGKARSNEGAKLLSEIAAPFTGVPSSIAGKTIAYSPIGLIKGANTARKVIQKNIPQLQRQAAQEIGRGVMGTGVFALGAFLMQQGLMTGQAKDAQERALWKAQGKQQNSVFINGKWRGINSIGPQNLIMLAGAKYNESRNDPEGSFAKFGAAITKDQLQQTFLQGVQGPLQAINDPERFGKSYVGNTLGSLNPNIIKDISKAGDTVQRETNTIGDFIKQGIPGARQTLLPKRGLLGQELPQEPTGAGAFLDLFNSKTPVDTEILRELERLQEAGAPAIPSKINKKQTIRGESVTLTPEQIDQFERGSGIVLKPMLQKLIKSTRYSRLDDDGKQKEIRGLVSDVRSEWKKQNSTLLKGETEFDLGGDSPTGVKKTAVNVASFAANPVETIKLWTKGEPIKKLRLSGDTTFEQTKNFFGAITVSERATRLSGLDKGDKGTQVDHIKPKWLGGREKMDNYQILTNAEHSKKTKLGTEMREKFEAGDITKQEAWKQIRAFNDTLRTSGITDDRLDDLAVQATQKESDRAKKEAIEALFTGDRKTARQLKKESPFNLTNKEVRTKAKARILKEIFAGNNSAAKKISQDVGLSLTNKEVKKAAKREVIKLIKKNKMDEARKLKNRFGIIILNKDVK